MLMDKKKKKKMMKLPSIFFKSSADDKSTWPWPSCRQPRTLSFRTNTVAAATDSSDSFFTLSSESSGSLSTASDFSGGSDPIERMIRGLRSERLLFEPAGKSSSILKEEENAGVTTPLKEGTTVLLMDSDDPFSDFRKSMEEMVEAHGMKDWESLEELLGWYLKVNARNNHGFIIGAFVDLLVTLATASSSSSSKISEKFVISPLSVSSCSSLCSSSSSSSSSNFLPCVSSSMEIEEITSLDEHHHHVFS